MKKIVISGTYCTGKTTITLALEKATGIPATHALTMREILPDLFPGKKLRDCSYSELICLGLKRFEDRIKKEADMKGSFISDGCPLQEWLYGSTRLITGAYHDEYCFIMALRKTLNYRSYKNFKLLLKGFEGITKAYTQLNYNIFFHLPADFPFVTDGHRPTSESFRKVSEIRLLETYQELNIKPYMITGSLEKRLEQILSILKIEPKYDINFCIKYAKAYRYVKFDNISLEK